MKRIFSLVISVLMWTSCTVFAGQNGENSFKWGNVTYFNLSVGEKLNFLSSEIELLDVKNHYNRLRVNQDTAWIKMCYRSTVTILGNLKVFVADNRNVKAIASDLALHGLLKKDALIAVCPVTLPLIDPGQFVFPVSFSGGYVWKIDEDSYPFSYQDGGYPKTANKNQFPGVALDLENGRDSGKFGILAIESGRVVWTETRNREDGQPKGAICLASGSSPGIYYIYRNLYNKQIFVKPNQQVSKGEELAYIWGEGEWQNLHLEMVHSLSVPSFIGSSANLINFFPQLMELYYGRQPLDGQAFTKGEIQFGTPAGVQGNVKNVSAYEDYLGTGWKLDKWNVADKVEWAFNQQTANARLSKTLFEGQAAQCTNPDNWYDYEIDVKEGYYRISSLVGDCYLPTWQRIEYEGVAAGTYQLNPGEFAWTPDKTVMVRDGRLTVRIYLSGQVLKAGISRIVFQQTD